MRSPIRIRWFTKLAIFLIVVVSPLTAAHAAPRAKPNIIVILADDLGYGDLGCQGCRDIATPHIDSLALHGVRCTSGYVTSPVCSPSRAGLMTGRYPQRFGQEFNEWSLSNAQAAEIFGLPLSETTLADRLKALGYATGIVGKWHLGFNPKLIPSRRGFDEFYGFLHALHSYVDPKGVVSPLRGDTNPLFRGGVEVDEKEYLTDALTREAVSFIDRHQREPFFLYLPFNAPHQPMETVKKYLDRVGGIEDHDRRVLASMMCAMDDGIGAVLRKLRQVGIEDNTLIFFLSDNGGGGPGRKSRSRNDPLRGHKGQLLEGGIRIPFLVQWTGHLPAGKVYDEPVMALDIVPTAISAAGGTIGADAKLDGVDLLPHLLGQSTAPPHASCFWRYGVSFAMRQGNFKLLGDGKKPPQLFDLAQDISEKNDLAEKQPDRAEQMMAKWRGWDRELVKPLWSSSRE